jgi:hypothetical protein
MQKLNFESLIAEFGFWSGASVVDISLGGDISKLVADI